MWPFKKKAAVVDKREELFTLEVKGLQAATQLWNLGIGVEKGKESFWVIVFWWDGKYWHRRQI
jgi:hypothetical protein